MSDREMVKRKLRDWCALKGIPIKKNELTPDMKIEYGEKVHFVQFSANSNSVPVFNIKGCRSGREKVT